MPKMTHDLWKTIRNFTPSEKWGDAYKMDYNLIKILDIMRDNVDRPIHIHCGYEARSTGGMHPMGLAADLHIDGLSVLEQFLEAQRYAFGGIGLYPFWNNPGLHVDVRPRGMYDKRALWGCNSPGDYVAVTRDFIRKCM